MESLYYSKHFFNFPGCPLLVRSIIISKDWSAKSWTRWDGALTTAETTRIINYWVAVVLYHIPPMNQHRTSLVRELYRQDNMRFEIEGCYRVWNLFSKCWLHCVCRRRPAKAFPNTLADRNTPTHLYRRQSEFSSAKRSKRWMWQTSVFANSFLLYLGICTYSVTRPSSEFCIIECGVQGIHIHVNDVLSHFVFCDLRSVEADSHLAERRGG